MFEWLRDYRRLEDDVAYLEFNLDNSERELKRWVEGDLSGVKLTALSDGAQLEERIEKIRKELSIKENDRENFLKLISRFNGLDNKIIRLKYIDGMTLERVAEELCYSTDYINKRHQAIAKQIKFAHEIKSSF